MYRSALHRKPRIAHINIELVSRRGRLREGERSVLCAHNELIATPVRDLFYPRSIPRNLCRKVKRLTQNRDIDLGAGLEGRDILRFGAITKVGERAVVDYELMSWDCCLDAHLKRSRLLRDKGTSLHLNLHPCGLFQRLYRPITIILNRIGFALYFPVQSS